MNKNRLVQLEKILSETWDKLYAEGTRVFPKDSIVKIRDTFYGIVLNINEDYPAQLRVILEHGQPRLFFISDCELYNGGPLPIWIKGKGIKEV